MSSNPSPLPLTVALPGGQEGYFKVHPRRYVKQPDGSLALLEEPKPLHDGSTVADLVLAVSTAHSWQWGALIHIAGSPDPLRTSAGLWDLLIGGVSAFEIHPAALPLTVKLPGGEQEGTFPVYKRAPVQQADGTVVLQAPGRLHDGSFVADLILLVSTDGGIAHNWEWGALLHIADKPDDALPNSDKLWDLLTPQGQSAFGIRPAPAPAVPDELRTLTLSTLAADSTTTTTTATVRVLLVSVNTDKSKPLAVDAEALAMIKKLQRHRHMHCRLEEDITLAALSDVLADFDPHAVHIMCHSTETELRFPGSTPGAQLLAGDLSAALQRAPSCKLVVLNACNTATLARHVLDAEAATVVFSTTQRVLDETASTFAVRLWGLLAEGRPIGAAFEDAIRQLPVAWRVAHQVGMTPAPPQPPQPQPPPPTPPADEGHSSTGSTVATSSETPGWMMWAFLPLAFLAIAVLASVVGVLDPSSTAATAGVFDVLATVATTAGLARTPPPPPTLHERLLRHSAQQRANDAQWQLCRPFLVAPVVRDRLEETADHTALLPLWEASVLAHALAAAQKHDPTTTIPPLPTKGFALYGSPGSGKSTCLLRFEELVWERFDAATHPVLPVRLLLSQVAADDADPVKSHLINMVGYSEAEVEELNRRFAFVILLDGFDEMKRGQLLMTEELVGYGGSIVVSGRLQSLREFQLFHGGDGLDERYLCALDGEQIAGYMRKRQETAPALTDATIAATLANPALMGITTTPLMLSMLVDVLLEPGSSGEQQQLVQRFDLYERFTQRWFDREFRKLVAQKQLAGLPSSDAALDVSSALSTYAERIALLMFQRNTLEISGEELRAEERAVLAATLHPDAVGTLRLRQACPLKTLDGEVYQFMHKSFMEFLVARQLLHGGGNRAVVEALLGGGRRIQEEPQILLFLHEAWTSEKHTRDVEQLRPHLFAIVPDSASNPELAAASSNAATWLNWMQESLSGVAWAGARLQGADLAHSVMAGSDLRGADLRGVSFKASTLYGADVSRARMAGVEFGELPLMECGDRVRCMAASSDGVVACGLRSGAIQLWDVARQERIGRLTGHNGTLWSVAFSKDGRRLVSGGEDGTVRVWDVAEQRAIGEPMRGHGGAVRSVAFHPNGRIIASGSDDDKTIRFWDAERQVADGEPLTGHSSWVWSVAFSPDGKLLASGSGDKTVRLWDVERRSSVGEPLEGHTNEMRCVAFSPDGRWLASGSVDSTIRLWDVARREAVGQPLRGHTSHVLSLAFSPNSRRLASGSSDATVRVWDVARQQPIGKPLIGHSDSVWSVAFTPDGRQLVSGSADRTLRVWEVEGREEVGQPLMGHRSAVYAIAFSPNGERLASGSWDATVRVWSVERQQSVVEPLAGQDGNIYCVAFHPDGRRLASGSLDKTIRIWDVERQEADGQPLLGHSDAIRGVAFSPDGQLLASSSWDKTVRLWNVETLEQVGEPLRGHTDKVWSVAFSPDGRSIASASQDKTIRLWSVERREAIGEPMEGHGDRVNTVAFSPAGLLLASGSVDKTIQLWDVEQQKALGSAAKGHSRPVQSVAFSSDGRRLVSGSRDQTVRIWGLSQGRELKPLAVIPWCCDVNAVAFTPNSSTKLAFGDDQGSVVFFEETAENTWTWTPPRRCSSRGLNAALLKHENCIGLDPTVARLLDQAGPTESAMSMPRTAESAFEQ